MPKLLTEQDPILRYDAAELTPKDRAQARKNIGVASAEATPEKYFDITDDGVISLKPEYRGGCSNAEFTYGVSDNGADVDGSKNSELPEDIVIPEVVNEIAVTALAEGMFFGNYAVKSITVPAFVAEIPKSFCYLAANLKVISGTENVKVIRDSAFARTAVEKVSFPALEQLDGIRQFFYCPLLVVADLGSKITALPKEVFSNDQSLSVLRNVQNVTSIGVKSLNYTKRLLPPAFLSKLTSIGDSGFLRSRVSYDWASLTGCTFGTNATSLQTNPTDFWSGCTPTPCETPMRSTFEQHNPEWADAAVDNVGTTYKDGCLTICAAMIYSVFEGKDLSSPQGYIEAVRAIDPSLLDLDSRLMASQIQYLNAVGYSAELKTCNAENLQTMYDALAAGALVISAVITTSGDHAVVYHGINEKGEVLVVDPTSYAYHFGDYRAWTYPAPIQNISNTTDRFLIVRKN